MNTVTLDEVRRRIHELPPLPRVVMELLASLDREDVNVDVLVKKTVRSLTTTAALMSALTANTPVGFDAIPFWRHSIAVAICARELAMLGIDHAAVGQALTQHWRFPEELQQAVAGHHAPLVGGRQTLSLVVRAADVIAHALDLSRHWDDLVPPVPTGLWQRLGLDDKTLLSVFENTEKQFASASLVVDT